MTSRGDFTAYPRRADSLIGEATNDQLADVARLLALNIGYYQEKHEDVPQEKLVSMVRAQTLDEEAKSLLLRGMQNLVSALGEVMGVEDEGCIEAPAGSLALLVFDLPLARNHSISRPPTGRSRPKAAGRDIRADRPLDAESGHQPATV